MGTYNYTGNAQFVTVTNTNGGKYAPFTIKAYGAQGGYSVPGNYGAQGGEGAETQGYFALYNGEKLEIIVGGKGSGSNDHAVGGSGGGGTFVLKVNQDGSLTPLIAAGGGGGAKGSTAGGAGAYASMNKSTNKQGVVGGGGGAYRGQGAYGGGGAGENSNGITGPAYSGAPGGGGGFNRSGNYAGGAGGYDGYAGGFGGGGGSANSGGGGGGGYAGGNGGTEGQAAGGGGSYISSSALYRSGSSGVHSGNGLVVITPAVGNAQAPTTAAIYDTSAGQSTKAAPEMPGNTFGFSFTTGSASTLNSYEIAVNNPGGGTGTLSAYIYSNSANNTPGTERYALGTENDSAFASGETLVSGTGNGFTFAADTRYWLVAVNSSASNLQFLGDNGSPGIGYANEYVYNSSESTTQSFANGSTPTDGQILVTVCFAAGTRIRTTRGDVAVEALNVGDLAITASGEARPIGWLGHRSVDCRRHPRPQDVMPVRIAAHALGENRPARDLLVSPGHAISLDLLGEVLVPAIALVNGATIAQDDVDSVTYWHVELDSHDIILAENLLCESYLDMDNRDFFEESDVVALDASPDADAALRTHADFCRPFYAHGKLVEVACDQLRARAKTLGWRLVAPDVPGDLWLEVDGVRVEPARAGLVARALLPATAREVFLCSTSAVPAQTTGEADGRRLGAKLAGLVIDDGLACRREIGCGDPRLTAGFYGDEGAHRWSDGRARLPAELWAGVGADFYLRLALAGPLLPRWVAPRAATQVEATQAA